MKRRFLPFLCTLTLFGAWLAFAHAAEAPSSPPPAARASEGTVLPGNASTAAQALEQQNAAAAAAVASGQVPRAPDFLEHLVDVVLALFDVTSSGNTATHYAIGALLLVAALLLRRVVTGILFNQLKKLAARTTTTFDDKLFPALEPPVASFIMLVGIFAALKVLKLSIAADESVGYGSTVAFSLVIFWGLLRAFNSLLDHAQELARAKQLGIAAFMPWIKKTLIAIFMVFGVLMVAQSLGADVKAFLAGLGIGGLAFALAAQDTLANVFGSIVVAIDQPFKLGDFVQIGPHLGMVEDIGLRSTRLRRVDKSLLVIPNKSVASEAIANLSRFAQRRVEQVLGLTYDTKPEQMDAILAEIRRLILAEPEVDPTSVLVYFRDFSASSLDIWVVYLTKHSDFPQSMELKQRLNLAFMRAIAARGLSFAFPTQTVMLDGEPVRRLAAQKNPPSA